MAKPKLTVTDLERELHFKNERIAELKNEIDELHHLVQRMEEHAQEHDEYLETFITTFGLTLNDLEPVVDEVTGVASFMERARDSKMTLFI